MKPITRLVGAVACVAVLAGASGLALAIEGVVLIDQFRAIEGGVTVGDGPGFPVEINQPGSYRLSGNLTLANPNTTAIRIKSTNVTLDLNGFTVQGPTVCGFDPSGSTFGCRNTGSGVGIAANNPRDQSGGVTVVNGTVQGMGSVGVSVSRMTGAVVRNITAIGNGTNGIYAYSALLDGVSTSNNGGAGIDINFGSLKDSMSTLNGGDGVTAYHALLRGNFLQGNGGYGLGGQAESSTAHNLIQGNVRGDIGPQLVPLQLDKSSCGTGLCP